jgi:sorbitol/mannitol transport system permease protein
MTETLAPFSETRLHGLVQNRAFPRRSSSLLMAPALVLLFAWMIVPLALTLWFSLQRYNLQDPSRRGFVGLDNYYYLLTDPSLTTALLNTILIVGCDLAITIVVGILLALIFDHPFRGRSIARLLVITPFFVMPTVSALIWKNLLMHPVYGLFAWVSNSLGFAAVDWFADWPLASIIVIVAWEWTPFATLIFLTSLQSLDREQVEAARMDGARGLSLLWFITLPHLARPIAIVVMLETIFFLVVYAEIVVTTVGGPGLATTNLTFLIYSRALLGFDVGGASAAGVIAIILANVVTILFVRTIARQM